MQCISVFVDSNSEVTLCNSMYINNECTYRATVYISDEYYYCYCYQEFSATLLFNNVRTAVVVVDICCTACVVTILHPHPHSFA